MGMTATRCAPGSSPARPFNGNRILGAILFEMTMDRRIEGKGSAEYLWEEKNVVPFVKVDKGLAGEVDGAQVMKPMPDLDALVARAKTHSVYGTKMRSVIKLANKSGVDGVVGQQFEIGRRILGGGLVPIIEPEIDIHSPEKAAAEELLKSALIDELDRLEAGQLVMLGVKVDKFDADDVGTVDSKSLLSSLFGDRVRPGSEGPPSSS
jgi:fructose-bisphosphate aldolase class I